MANGIKSQSESRKPSEKYRNGYNNIVWKSLKEKLEKNNVKAAK